MKKYYLISLSLLLIFLIVGCTDSADRDIFLLENQTRSTSGFENAPYLDIAHYTYEEMSEEERITFSEARKRMGVHIKNGLYEFIAPDGESINISDSLYYCVHNLFSVTNQIISETGNTQVPLTRASRKISGYENVEPYIRGSSGKKIDCSMWTISHTVGSSKSYHQLVLYADSYFPGWRQNEGVSDTEALRLMSYSGFNFSKNGYVNFYQKRVPNSELEANLYPMQIVGNPKHFVNLYSCNWAPQGRQVEEFIYYDYQNPEGYSGDHKIGAILPEQFIGVFMP